MDHAGASLSDAQRHVLLALKRAGEATADELAATLQISSSAARQHLGILRSAGFVTARRDRGQPGRPAERYRATDLSEPLFTGDDGALSAELLGHVAAEDPELLTRVFDRRRHDLVERAAPELDGKPLDDRIDTLAELLDDQGYLADAERLDDDHYRINLHNCAMWSVANNFDEACTSELRFIQDLVPDTSVERLTHKTCGAHTCTYDIRATPADPVGDDQSDGEGGDAPGLPTAAP